MLYLDNGTLPLTPYVLGYAPISRHVLDPIAQFNPLFLDISDPASMPFYRLVNAGNNMSYQGLGMPPWVQLDCATLPSAMIGFATERHHITDALWEKLVHHTKKAFGDEAAQELQSYTGLIPVSEYCAIPTLQPDTLVGFSLFATLSKRALGVRTKALALLAYNTSHQIGMTQYTNTAVTTHATFGPLHIVQPITQPHSQPHHTFIYRIRVPSTDTLLDLIQNGPSHTPTPPKNAFHVPITHPNLALHIQSLIQTHGPLSIITTLKSTHHPTSLILAPSLLSSD